MPGWINIDIKPCPTISLDTPYVQCDLTNRFPINDECIDVIFSSHLLEHLEPIEEAEFFIAECYRVLKRGGIIRIIVPDFDKLIEYYYHPKDFYCEYNYDKPWFRENQSWDRRFAISVMNQHKMIYNKQTLLELLSLQAFTHINFPQKYDDTVIDKRMFNNIQPLHISHSLVCEAIK